MNGTKVFELQYSTSITIAYRRRRAEFVACHDHDLLSVLCVIFIMIMVGMY